MKNSVQVDSVKKWTRVEKKISTLEDRSEEIVTIAAQREIKMENI